MNEAERWATSLRREAGEVPERLGRDGDQGANIKQRRVRCRAPCVVRETLGQDGGVAGARRTEQADDPEVLGAAIADNIQKGPQPNLRIGRLGNVETQFYSVIRQD